MKYEINNRWDGKVIYQAEADSFSALVQAAVKSRANLSRADLYGAAAAYRAKAAEVEAMRGELANTKAIEGDALMLSENDLRSVRTVETPVQIK